MHQSQIFSSGFRSLANDEEVEYTLVFVKGKPQAEHVTVSSVVRSCRLPSLVVRATFCRRILPVTPCAHHGKKLTVHVFFQGPGGRSVVGAPPPTNPMGGPGGGYSGGPDGGYGGGYGGR